MIRHGPKPDCNLGNTDILAALQLRFDATGTQRAKRQRHLHDPVVLEHRDALPAFGIGRSCDEDHPVSGADRVGIRHRYVVDIGDVSHTRPRRPGQRTRAPTRRATRRDLR